MRKYHFCCFCLIAYCCHSETWVVGARFHSATTQKCISLRRDQSWSFGAGCLFCCCPPAQMENVCRDRITAENSNVTKVLLIYLCLFCVQTHEPCMFPSEQWVLFIFCPRCSQNWSLNTNAWKIRLLRYTHGARIWSVSARSYTRSLTTLATWIIDHVQNKVYVFIVFIVVFHTLSCTKHEPAWGTHTYFIMSSSNEICANWTLIQWMNAMTRLFWYTKDNDLDRKFKEEWTKKSNYVFILPVLNYVVFHETVVLVNAMKILLALLNILPHFSLVLGSCHFLCSYINIHYSV